MILRICKSILLFFGRMFDAANNTRNRYQYKKPIEVAVLPEIDPMAPFEEAAEMRMQEWGYGQDIVPKDNIYNVRI